MTTRCWRGLPGFYLHSRADAQLWHFVAVRVMTRLGGGTITLSHWASSPKGMADAHPVLSNFRR